MTYNPYASPSQWSLWRERRPAVVLIAVVFAAAVAAAVPIDGVDTGQLPRFAAIAGLGCATTIACWRMERARKFLEAGRAPNLSATWTFAAMLCLNPFFAAATAVLVYFAQWGSQRDVYVGRPHRYLYGASTVLIGVRAADFVHIPLLGAVVLVGINTVLIAAVLAASGDAAGIKRMADPGAHVIEAVTMVLGLVTAVLLEKHLILGAVTMPAILTVQYAALYRSIRRPSTIDTETGVLTAKAWTALAQLRLAWAREAVVLQIEVTDLGGRTWSECAGLIRAGLRGEDLIGRSNDGFVVMMAGAGGTLLAETLALTLHARLAIHRIQTHIGSAVTPNEGNPVDVQGLVVTAEAEVIVRAAELRV